MNRNGTVGMLILASALALLLPMYGQSAATETGEILIHTGKVDINHGVGAPEPIDQLDIALTFTNTEASEGGVCHASDNPVTHGLILSVQEGACGAASAAVHVTVPKFTRIAPGFFKFEGTTVENASVDAMLRSLPKPKGTCARFHLKLDALPLDLSSITANPVALSIQLPDGSSGCVSINKATIE